MVLQKILPIFMLLAITAAKSNDTQWGHGELTMIFPNGGGNNASNESSKVFCFEYPDEYIQLGGQDNNKTKLYNLENRLTIDPCNNNGTAGTTIVGNDTIILMTTHKNCSLGVYLNYTRRVSSVGLILLTDKLYNFKKEALDHIEIFGIVSNDTKTKDAINEIIEKGSSVKLKFKELKEDDSFESSTLLLWVLACFCVAVGALTGPYYDPNKRSNAHQQILDGDAGSNTVIVAESKPHIDFNIKLVLIMVIFITTTLLLLYFFFSYLVYFFMVVFCIASGRAVFELAVQVMNLCKMDDLVPKIKGYGIHRYMLAIICTTLPIVWFIFRHEYHIWILADILGVSFCIHLIQSLKIPNLKICSALLSLLFVYDIFFVFITPYITSNGKSIMLEVATGGGSGETLPVLLQVPQFRARSICSNSLGFSLLGFGDIILPGFLVCFAHAYDIARGDRFRPYFITTMLGYAFGLLFAFFALYLTKQGQPALLYIVPTVLIPLYIVAALRKQLGDIWKGVIINSEP